MGSFNATKVGLERMAGFFNDLPLGIDEKQVAGSHQDFIDSLVYMLSLGTSKVRGSKSGGLQDSENWRCIVLTTGEEPLSSVSSQDGIYTRTLEIKGAPFDNEYSAREIHNITSCVYGHGGPEFIKELTYKLGEQPYILKYKYDGIQKYLTEEYPDKLGSHITAVSLVAAADSFVSEWIFKDEDKSLKMAEEIMENLENRAESDVAQRAYEFIRNWVISNDTQFTDDARSPRYGYFTNETYYIFPHIIQDALEKYGFAYKKTISALGDRGLIGTSYEGEKKRFQVAKRFEGKVARFLEFKINDLKESTPF